MIQDPNVERLIRKSIEPLNKQISMLQIELEGVKKQLAIPRVSFSLHKRTELLKKAQEESEKKVDRQLPLDLQQHNYQNGIIEYLLDYIYGSNES